MAKKILAVDDEPHIVLYYIRKPFKPDANGRICQTHFRGSGWMR